MPCGIYQTLLSDWEEVPVAAGAGTGQHLGRVDNPFHRFLVAAIALLLAGGVAALTNVGKETAASPRVSRTTATPPANVPLDCLQLPPRRDTPASYPKTLPLPAGSYATDPPPSTGQYERVLFAVPTTLSDFVRHVLAVWPREGWVLGRGEAEPGEAEDNFYRPSANVVGAFRARTVFCDPNWTWVFIIFGQSRAPGPTPTVSPSPLVR